MKLELSHQLYIPMTLSPQKELNENQGESNQANNLCRLRDGTNGS